ncbi:hypothetical protein QYF36_008364 [Acer negundo]|nr:hypothetical protein QYF36_008364 [Acer negundo]
MSCAAGKTPAPGQAVYSASKYALNRYFHTLRSEFCQKGIKVTVVCPGRLETSNGYGATASEKKASSEKRVSSERAICRASEYELDRQYRSSVDHGMIN